MTEAMTLSEKDILKQKKRERRSRRWAQIVNFVRLVFRSPSAKLGGVIVAVIVLSAIFAPILAPYDPYEMDIQNLYSSPTLKHPFGTDSLGRDLLSRIIYGGRCSLSIGLFGTLIGSGAGIVLGSIAGYFGGQVENLIMRFCDIWSAIPSMLLMLLISSALGTGLFNTVLAISLGGIPLGARMIRGQILAERSKEYLEAAECINCSKTGIMFRHMLPNVVAPSIILMAGQIGGALQAASSLSYLGLGIQPPTPEWGALMADGTAYFQLYPHLLIFPGLVLGLAVLGFNLVGDGLRDAMDPRLRN